VLRGKVGDLVGSASEGSTEGNKNLGELCGEAATFGNAGIYSCVGNVATDAMRRLLRIPGGEIENWP